MKEYMVRVLNIGTHERDWSDEKHLEFIKKCEAYIDALKNSGNLIAAQPLAKNGVIISKDDGVWHEESLDVSKEIQVGYYHIRAKSLADAVDLARGNPEFEYSPTARLEVRPIKEEEEDTGFVYPTR